MISYQLSHILRTRYSVQWTFCNVRCTIFFFIQQWFMESLITIFEPEILVIRNKKSWIRRFDWLPIISYPIFWLVGDQTREADFTKSRCGWLKFPAQVYHNFRYRVTYGYPSTTTLHPVCSLYPNSDLSRFLSLT